MLEGHIAIIRKRTQIRGVAAAIVLRVVAIFGLVLLANCSDGARTGQPHVLRIAYASDPGSLDPLIAIDQDVIALNLYYCQTLVGLSADNRVVPILVTRVPSRQNGDISPNGTTITYHLRPEARFADGVPLTSADVAFTYRAIFDPRNRATSVQPYRRIASLRTPDAHTVVIRLRQPWNAAVRVLFAQADYAYGILPKHAFRDTKVVGTRWEDAPFGSGPFRVTEWQRSDRIVLEPNRYYRPRPKLSRIIFDIVPNLNSNFVALQSGAVDVGVLTPDNVERAARISGLRVVRTPENGAGLLYLRTQTTPTSDVRVRRAIAYALDPSALSNAWRHAYRTATSFLPPPVVRWRSAVIPAYPHDLSAANRELEAAGWHMEKGVRMKDGEPLRALIGADADNPINVRIATLVQSQLAVAGMGVSVKTNPTRVWFSFSGLLRNGSAAMVSETWLGGSDPEQSVNLRCAEAVKGGDNHSFYCSRSLDALFADQARERREAQRDRDFDEMQQLVHDDVPIIPLYYEILLEGINKRVSGYQKNMLRYPVDPEKWDAR